MLSIQIDTKSLELVFAGASRMRNLLQKSNGLYHCPQCDHTNRNRTDLERHIETYHLDLEYPCEYCDRVFKTRRRYQRHVRSHHPGMNYRIAWLLLQTELWKQGFLFWKNSSSNAGKDVINAQLVGTKGLENVMWSGMSKPNTWNASSNVHFANERPLPVEDIVNILEFANIDVDKKNWNINHFCWIFGLLTKN